MTRSIPDWFSMNQSFQLENNLVAVSMQRVGNRAGQCRLQHSGSTELSNLLSRFANRQVTRAALSVLYLARCG